MPYQSLKGRLLVSFGFEDITTLSHIHPTATSINLFPNTAVENVQSVFHQHIHTVLPPPYELLISRLVCVQDSGLQQETSLYP